MAMFQGNTAFPKGSFQRIFHPLAVEFGDSHLPIFAMEDHHVI
jgi:hypothetical protein